MPPRILSLVLLCVPAAVVSLLLAGMTGCGGGSDGAVRVSSPNPAALTAVSGNYQSGTVGEVLPSPLVVRVDDQSGRPYAGATVTWTITSGGGAVDHASSMTGGDGTVSALWTLGTQAGDNALTATSGALSPVSFTATGTAGSFANIVITSPNASVETGDVLQLSAAAADVYGNVLPHPLPPLSWASSDSNIARVTADGFLIALGPGTISISASSGEITGSLPLTINAGITISLGAEEMVFQWSTDRCEDLDLPDVPAHVVRLADGTLVLIDGDAPRTYASFGADFSSLQHDCAQFALSSGVSYYPESYDNWEWIHSIYREGDIIHALIHNEYHDPISADCAPGDTGPGNPCWYNSVTYAFSTDGGHTFSHATPPGHVVAPPWQEWDPTGPPPPYGYFNPSNIVHGQDGFYYAMIPALDRSGEGGGCVMRTQTLDDPTSWRGWDGTGFSLQLTSPYTGPTPARCMSVLGIFGQPSLTYNTYLGRYMMFGMTAVGGPTEVVGGFFYTLSSDLINWTPERFVRAAYIPWCCFDWSRTDAIAAVYPSIIDHEDSTPNFERPGRTPYLYYTRPNDYPGRRDLDRDLVRIPMTITLH
jgi:hypothetical protein